MAEKSVSTSVARSAGAMGLATLMSRVLGLVREQVFAYFFGAGLATDAFQIAFRIPNLLRDLFAEGAMSASLVPTFTRVRETEGEQRAWQVAGRVFGVLFAGVSVLSLFGIFFAPQLVRLYAGSFQSVPGKFELTVFLTRILFPFFPLVALAAAFMGILNACGVFFWPAFASALFNLASILVGVAGVWIAPLFGLEPIVGMAVGVVFGGGVQAFCQIPSLVRVGFRWQKSTKSTGAWFRDPALRSMLWLMLPGTMGLAATQLNVLINSVLATSQGPGAVSWLNYAFRLMQFPIGIFGVSLASATLPRVSKFWVRGEIGPAARTLEQSIEQVLTINLPAAVGLAALGEPVIALLFEYGRFTAADTAATARVLAMYAVGLAAYSGVKVLVPICYAVGRTRFAVGSSLLSVALTVVLNLSLVGPLGYAGLALGTSLAAVLNFGFLWVGLSRTWQERGEELRSGGVLRESLKVLVLALGMGGVCYAGSHWSPGIAYLQEMLPLGVARGLWVLFWVGVGVGFMGVGAQILGVRAFLEGLRFFTSKIRQRLGYDRL